MMKNIGRRGYRLQKCHFGLKSSRQIYPFPKLAGGALRIARVLLELPVQLMVLVVAYNLLKCKAREEETEEKRERG